MHQDVRFDFTADFIGTEDRSVMESSLIIICNEMLYIEVLDPVTIVPR